MELYNYLLSCPIILDIPEYDLYVVHAGLLPDVPLFEQDPSDLMSMVLFMLLLLFIKKQYTL